MPAELTQQRLIFGMFRVAVAQMVGDFSLRGFSVGLVRPMAVTIRVSQRHCLPQQPLEPLPEVAGSSYLRLQRVNKRPLDVRQALLLWNGVYQQWVHGRQTWLAHLIRRARGLAERQDEAASSPGHWIVRWVPCGRLWWNRGRSHE